MTLPSSFRSVVLELLAAGRLTPQEANELLDDVNVPQAAQQEARPGIPPVLLLEVSSVSLNVVIDPNVDEPLLGSSRENAFHLEGTPGGWRLTRTEKVENGWGKLLSGSVDSVASFAKVLLTLPFVPERVKVTLHGGQVILPPVVGELDVTIRGGTITAGRVERQSRMSVNGGTLTVEQASGLVANVNGGHLRWTGRLQEGQHFLEVNGGQATLNLAGSDVRVNASVSVGQFQADFRTQKTGKLMSAQYYGELGRAQAVLDCRVRAGQVRLTSRNSGLEEAEGVSA